jgi:hypothetical protein
LIKVDVEGAEIFVFQGAEKLLNLPSDRAPIWFFEYIPANYAAFGYMASELLDLLKEKGYGIWQYCGSGKIDEFNSSDKSVMLNLIAAKDKNYLLSLLS